jgi:hypothetical protein
VVRVKHWNMPESPTLVSILPTPNERLTRSLHKLQSSQPSKGIIAQVPQVAQSTFDAGRAKPDTIPELAEDKTFSGIIALEAIDLLAPPAQIREQSRSRFVLSRSWVPL